MFFDQKSGLNLSVCGHCQGAGFLLTGSKCPECKGYSVGYFKRGLFLYWGEPITDYYIKLRKGRRILDKFRIISSLFIGLLFFILYIYFLFNDGAENKTSVYSFLSGEKYSFLLWLALINFGYLLYRIMVLGLIQDRVETNLYRTDSVSEEQNTDFYFDGWQKINVLPRSRKKDIADTFDNEARLVLENAYQTAFNEKSDFTSAQLFYSLLSVPKINGIFVRMNISAKELQEVLFKIFIQRKEQGKPAITPDVWQILFRSYEIAYNNKSEHVSVIELLEAVVNQEKFIQELLYDLKVEKEKFDNVVEWLRIREKIRRQYQIFRTAAKKRSKYGMDRAMTAVATPYLNQFSEDITMSAKYGGFFPCVARDKEIDEIFRVIEGGGQSVLLVGERGVGKMSVIQGLAERMIEDKVPYRIQDKRLVQLSNSSLLAGTSISGAQERLMRIMYEVGKAKNVILFIKNIHELIGGEGTLASAGGMDVASTLADYLSSGRFLTLATTNVESYNRFIANSEINSVFSKVEIKEMDENQTIQVLESRVGSLEYKHNIFFSYESLEQAVKMSKRFLHDQKMPESAINLLSEVAGYVKSKKGVNHLVDAEDVGYVLSQKTGIPATSISLDESAKLLNLEQEMHERIIGQSEAVSLVANALRRARAEIRSGSRPISSFLFLGPTGVGKTELAKTIAGVYFGGENRMIRIDMSEYQDKMSIYRLIGEPGKQGTGILTEAVRQNPFSLILFDEMEKADPDILNIFLQVMDDGRLTDSVGRVIDFTNTIIIATSNAGTDYVQKQIQLGLTTEEIRQNLIRGELKKYYRPEFLNRFDAIVLFKSLEKQEIKEIAKLMIKRVENDLKNKGFGLKVLDEALDYLAEIGFDQEFGARPMRRAIQDYVENKLAELIITNRLQRRDVVVVGQNLKMWIE